MMSIFPASRSYIRQVATTKKVRIFFHCGETESQRMVRCPKCAEWFHDGCKVVRKRDWKNPALWLHIKKLFLSLVLQNKCS